jgi:RHS repeat-associated protein
MRAGFVRHNRIEVFEDKRYEYDVHGRVTKKRIGSHTVIHFQWNCEHQLTESIIERNGKYRYIRYEYDALGRRTARRDYFGTSEFLWDGLRLLQEKRYSEISTYVYQPGSHEPLARIDNKDGDAKLPDILTKVYHFHNHINGAPEELTNEAGEIVWQGRYESWGRLALQRVAENFRPDPGCENVVSPQPLRMQGQYAEVETGLCYNTFRYYDPDIGRFISEDPIGLFGGPNLYAFAPNTDAWVDPWGWASAPCALSGGQKYKVLRAKGLNRKEAVATARGGNYTDSSRAHLTQSHHHANSTPLGGKSKFKPTEGGQNFTDEVLYHPNTIVTRQTNGRLRFDNSDLGRTTGRATNGAQVRGGRVVIEGTAPHPYSSHKPGQVVTQFPQ